MLKYRLCKFFASCLHAAESWHPIYQHQCLTVRLMLARLWVTTSALISWSLSRPKLFLDHHRIFLNDQILGKILVNFQLGWNPLTFYASWPDLNIYGDRNVGFWITPNQCESATGVFIYLLLSAKRLVTFYHHFRVITSRCRLFFCLFVFLQLKKKQHILSLVLLHSNASMPYRTHNNRENSDAINIAEVSVACATTCKIRPSLITFYTARARPYHDADANNTVAGFS